MAVMNNESGDNDYGRPRMNSEDSSGEEAQWVVRISTNEVNNRHKKGITEDHI